MEWIIGIVVLLVIAVIAFVLISSMNGGQTPLSAAAFAAKIAGNTPAADAAPGGAIANPS